MTPGEIPQPSSSREIHEMDAIGSSAFERLGDVIASTCPARQEAQPGARGDD